MKKLKNLFLVALVLFVGLGFCACKDTGNSGNNNSGNNSGGNNAGNTKQTYTITYLETKGMANSNPTTYTEDTETIILKDLEDTDDYEFLGWYNGEAKVTEITKGSKGNLTLTAKWSKKLLIIYENSVVGVTSAGKVATKIEIPNGITSILDNAFSYCTLLSEIKIPDSVNNISKGAFIGCISLKNIVIPDNVTSIGDSAFKDCSNLTNITLPNSVISIGNGVFNGCDSLQEMTLPFAGNSETENTFLGYIFGASEYSENFNYVPKSLKKVTITKSIGENAFGGCSELLEIIIGDSITNISKRAFYGCSGLMNMIIPNNVIYIKENAFQYCVGLSSIEIPNSVTTIGDSVFSGCSGLVNVSIGESITSISNNAFSGCNNLKNITIPDNVTSIGKSTFSYCRSLTSITIPNSVTTIGDSVFSGCSGLVSVSIGERVTSISNNVFSGCNNLKNIIIPNNITSIGIGAFSGCSSLDEMTIPFVGGSETENTYFGYIFGADDYYRNSNYVPKSLKKVTITNAVTIDGWAFYNCSDLLSIIIGNSITSIESCAFKDCIGLTEINIPNSVINIGSYAFCGCSNLTNITIPNSVTTIEGYAFYDCSSLEYNIYDNAKYLGNNENPYLVLVEAINTDITTCNINGNTKIIYGQAFENCHSLTSVTISNSVTSIGGFAFSRCSSLKYNTYDNAKYLGNNENPYLVLIEAINTDITKCTINNNTKIIYNYAFSNCNKLTSITIPSCVTNILSGAFTSCNNLKKVIFEDTKYWRMYEGVIQPLSSSELSNASNAAELLKRSSMIYWYKG